MKHALTQFPEIAEAYSVYLLCRQQHVAVYKSSKGKDTVQVVAPFTQGLSVLPEDGGMMDQPYRLMAFFSEFMDGERQAFFNPRR
jgi:hypothetical protein